MYLRTNLRKEFASETRRKYDSFIHCGNPRPYHQSSNHHNSHLNESDLGEGTAAFKEKMSAIRQTHGSLSKEKKILTYSKHRYLRKVEDRRNDDKKSEDKKSIDRDSRKNKGSPPSILGGRHKASD